MTARAPEGRDHPTASSKAGEERAIEVGDFYEDCSYQPRLCVRADYAEDELAGISLITGHVGSCSLQFCGPFRITVEQAIERRRLWPPAEVVTQARERGLEVDMPGGRVPAERVEPGACAEIW